MNRSILGVTLLLFATFLSGCFGDDNGGDGDDGTPTSGGPRPTGSMTGAPTTGPGPAPTPAGPIYINGTVTGVADCSLAPQAGAQMATTETVPAEAWNGTYQLSFLSDIPVTALCIAWGDDAFSTSMSGTVPAGATEVTVAADGAPQGASFSIVVTPAPASGGSGMASADGADGA